MLSTLRCPLCFRAANVALMTFSEAHAPDFRSRRKWVLVPSGGTRLGEQEAATLPSYKNQYPVTEVDSSQSEGAEPHRNCSRPAFGLVGRERRARSPAGRSAVASESPCASGLSCDGRVQLASVRTPRS